MISKMKKREQLTMDETSCGPMCQHPACWQSNTRREKGFPKMTQSFHPIPDIDLDLPTVKVLNMLDDYGDDPRDKFPARFGGKPQHERSSMMLNPVRANSIKVTRVPQTSPKSSNGQSQTAKPGPKFNFVEVQEVFEPEDLQATWDATFLPKKCYVWVPNKKKNRRRKKAGASVDGGVWDKTDSQFVRSKDVTEDMVPKDIENERLMAKKKCAQLSKSPSYRHYPMTPRTARSPSRMEYDPEGLRSTLSSKLSVPRTRSGLLYASISELLDLPRDILVQVLDNTKQSDLLSRDKIREIIQRFMPQSVDRGPSLASTDLLQPKKLSLHEGNKNLRQPHLMETKPVFYLDDDVVDEASQEDYDSEAYGSLKELYFGGGTAESQDLRKYKKPLPSITGGQSRAVSAGDAGVPKIPSISLGLPELPSGIRQTRPFTYSRKAEYDFTLEPAPRLQLFRLLTRITSSGEGYFSSRTPSMNVVTYNTRTPQVSRESEVVGETASEPVVDGTVSELTRRPTFVEEGSIVIPHGEVIPTENNSEKDDMPVAKQLGENSQAAPVPTPPTSIRSTETPGSEHGTTVRANVPSDITGRSEAGSSVKQSPRSGEAGPNRQQGSREVSPLHAVSPTFSTRVPKTPVTTPAVKSPSRSAPVARDGSTVTATPQEWPPLDKMGSPVHIRAPVNTPGSMSQDIGLGTIKEIGKDYSDQPLPMSRGGRSVRFEIPEVPPPPSSPQESDEGGLAGDRSRNTVTVNTIIPKDTPSVSNKLMSQVPTIPTDQNTVNTSVNTRESSLVKSGKSGSRGRELSMVSSPEPWPQVIEADFDITPNPKSDSTLHMATSEPKASTSGDIDNERNQSSNAVREIKVEVARHSPELEEPTSEFVNKDTEPVSRVKKMMAESRKSDSPAPPPPSPEAKTENVLNSERDDKIEAGSRSGFDEDEPSVTVMQIHPRGVTRKLQKQRQIDTFVNIDIPASHAPEPSKTEVKYDQRGTILEEPEPESELEENAKRETSESVQSTLANRTISEADTEATSSVVEPAISQASQGPALSEDFSEKPNKGQLPFGDWTGVVGGSDVDTQAMLSSDKQELDMTEDGGDHEGFKEDLKREYEKLEQVTKDNDDDSADKS